jgi:hypothetical protein
MEEFRAAHVRALRPSVEEWIDGKAWVLLGSVTGQRLEMWWLSDSILACDVGEGVDEFEIDDIRTMAELLYAFDQVPLRILVRRAAGSGAHYLAFGEDGLVGDRNNSPRPGAGWSEEEFISIPSTENGVLAMRARYIQWLRPSVTEVVDHDAWRLFGPSLNQRLDLSAAGENVLCKLDTSPDEIFILDPEGARRLLLSFDTHFVSVQKKRFLGLIVSVDLVVDGQTLSLPSGP